MNPVAKKALIAIAILAFAALLIKAFQRNFEYVEKTEWLPLRGEARTNPLYASKLFLRRMGIPTETVESTQDLSTLPDTNTVILISASRSSLRPPQISRLLDWVRNGGHLIISGVADWNFFSSDEPLVDESDNEDLPIYYDESETGDALQAFLEVDIREGIEFQESDSVAINLKGSDKPLQLGADYYRAIELQDTDKTDGLEQISINDKNVIIRQQVDNGLITLVSDFEFINNYKLADYDHAEILWQIVRGKQATLNQSDLLLPEAVWLIHSDEAANLFQIIWKKFWALAITAGLLLLFWILRISRRFGPLIAKESEDRRNLLEHIDASGTYYWKQKDQSPLLDSTRGAVQQQLAKRLPGWHATSQQDQIKLLAKRLNISETQLMKTLYGDASLSAYEFTETIKQLEYIRTSL